MLSLLWLLSESMCLSILQNLVCQLGFYLEQLIIFSLLGQLIMIHSHLLYIQIFRAHQDHSQKFLQKKTYLIWKVRESLDQKKLPHVVFGAHLRQI